MRTGVFFTQTLYQTFILFRYCSVYTRFEGVYTSVFPLDNKRPCAFNVRPERSLPKHAILVIRPVNYMRAQAAVTLSSRYILCLHKLGDGSLRIARLLQRIPFTRRQTPSLQRLSFPDLSESFRQKFPIFSF